MYSSCIYCNAPLGRNDVLEQFAVGRRLAFDPAKGRLWVVCLTCARWNLTPLEERWEAIEDCERRYRATRSRASTDNIGIAKLREGLELIRIGSALRPELAVWRYGSELVRRRSAFRIGQFVGYSGAVVGAALLPGYGMWAGWFAAGALVTAFRRRAIAAAVARSKTVLARVPRPDMSELYEVSVKRVWRTLLLPNGKDGWRLRLLYFVPGRDQNERPPCLDVAGEDALRALRLLLPQWNVNGGGRGVVDNAVTRLETAGAAPTFMSSLSARIEKSPLKPRDLKKLPAVDRLALEMALNEEIERRALEGELGLLETAWREAEEIAAIADGLFLPASVHALIHRHRENTANSNAEKSGTRPSGLH